MADFKNTEALNQEKESVDQYEHEKGLAQSTDAYVPLPDSAMTTLLTKP